MKKAKFSESQIITILKEAEAGVALEDLSRQHGFSVKLPKLVPMRSGKIRRFEGRIGGVTSPVMPRADEWSCNPPTIFQ